MIFLLEQMIQVYIYIYMCVCGCTFHLHTTTRVELHKSTDLHTSALKTHTNKIKGPPYNILRNVSYHLVITHPL